LYAATVAAMISSYQERRIILKEEYIKTELEIISFSTEDVISTSALTCNAGGNFVPEDEL
jgi:hypothetical protein